MSDESALEPADDVPGDDVPEPDEDALKEREEFLRDPKWRDIEEIEDL